MNQKSQKPFLKIILVKPRGFCAGVTRAIKTVEEAIKKFGSPVYVRHEIVHNRFVVDSLKEKGAIFIDEIDEAPTNRPVIFSAHGVPLSVVNEAKKRNLLFIDATCPLVEKVHIETKRHFKNGLAIILIGHKKHPEVIGTMGQITKGKITVIESLSDAENFIPQTGQKYAYVTQTTLSSDETSEIIKTLKTKIPDLTEPDRDDICYATTNRQNAVKKIAPNCSAIMVIGSPNSSNSQRLVEVSKASGCKNSFLVENPKNIDWEKLKNLNILGITAGASAPEILVREVISEAKIRFDVEIEEKIFTEEDLVFLLPASLRKT